MYYIDGWSSILRFQWTLLIDPLLIYNIYIGSIFLPPRFGFGSPALGCAVQGAFHKEMFAFEFWSILFFLVEIIGVK